MLSNQRQRQQQQHHSLQQASKTTDMFKQPILGTLSPDTTVTTSSGYSTGGSSVSTTINLSPKKSSVLIARKQQHKTKSKGLHNLLTKLKNLLVPSKTKPIINSKTMRSTNSRQISSTNILRQYHQQAVIYDVIPPPPPPPTLPASSSLVTNNTISLPFTYYHDSPIQQPRTNFEKISAWLDHTEKMTQNEQVNINSLSFIDGSQQLSTSSSTAEIDNKGASVYVLAITVVMKKTPTNIKPPKRSSSLVTRITRPIIEQQVQHSISPSSSFASSILTKGMTERMTPSPTTPRKTESQSSKSNRRRTIDFSRRRSVVDTTNRQKSNKENLPMKQQEKSLQGVYQFSPSSSNNKIENHAPSSKHVSTKKYFFHSNSTKTPDEDLLNNSYGLTLLSQQQQQPTPLQQRHSVAAVLMLSQVPNHISLQKQSNSRVPNHQYTVDSLDDLLCDREVESYFYPTSSPSEHIYMNLENSCDSYPTSLSCIHGTLC
ncbi:unnamed protein product [Adineta steineri]|uniref:Uncharacterized protein n=1 Tax=Adineta steineri TaxID=433720 RepID=A0A819AR91_9BILA|nr:unnamed protein product [Adineta steineri]